MRDVDGALSGLPPVFDLADAARVGLGARTTQRAVGRGLVHRLAPGLFTPMPVWRAADGRQRHLLLATVPRAAAQPSHRRGDPDGPSAAAAARAVVQEKVREDRLRSCGLGKAAEGGAPTRRRGRGRSRP